MTTPKRNMTNLTRYVSLVLLMLLYVNSFVDRQIIAVLGESIRQDLGLSFTNLGWLYGPSFSWVYAIMGLVMGRLADKTSRVRIILIGATVWSFATLASGWASSLGFLIAMRMALGLSQAALSPAVYSLLADVFPQERRATVYSAYASAIFIGVGLSFLVGGSVAQAYDWRISLQVLGASGFLLVGLSIVGLVEPSRVTYQGSGEDSIEQANSTNSFVSEESVWKQLRGLLSKPALRYHLLGFGLLAMSGYTILAFIGSIFTQGFDRADLIPRYGWFLVATAVAVNGAGWISDRWANHYGPRNRLAWGWISGLVSLPFLWVGLHSEHPMLAFWAIGIGNIIASSYNGVAAATIQFFARDDQRGLVGALYLFVVSVVGFGAGPPLAGWLSDHIFQGAMAVASAVWTIYLLCGIGSSVAFYLARKHYDQDVV